ncbi:hypothetical protein Hamer_G029150 [Homarus americanus]|uniref:Uncharacterized protein n=1 Tax=Homarus americanus TaxID=6706 RepID=A0A8J5JGT9_HOMAM|nr:hypothetical protein Hamer_G027318 [Homarus americanus]KAG7156030.1 hypothetical protein Hamer_G029150 [Homarus americanus]
MGDRWWKCYCQWQTLHIPFVYKRQEYEQCIQEDAKGPLAPPYSTNINSPLPVNSAGVLLDSPPTGNDASVKPPLTGNDTSVKPLHVSSQNNIASIPFQHHQLS